MQSLYRPDNALLAFLLIVRVHLMLTGALHDADAVPVPDSRSPNPNPKQQQNTVSRADSCFSQLEKIRSNRDRNLQWETSRHGNRAISDVSLAAATQNPIFL